VKICSVCRKEFSPDQQPTEPAEQAGVFFAREMYDDAAQLCLQCLASRGQLGMMYLREYD
jgi:hypothetical protein